MDKEHTIKLSEENWITLLAILDAQKKEVLKYDALEIQKIEDNIKHQIEEQIKNGN